MAKSNKHLLDNHFQQVLRSVKEHQRKISQLRSDIEETSARSKVIIAESRELLAKL